MAAAAEPERAAAALASGRGAWGWGPRAGMPATPARREWERAWACGASRCPWQLQWQRRCECARAGVCECVLVVLCGQEGRGGGGGGGSRPRRRAARAGRGALRRGPCSLPPQLDPVVKAAERQAGPAWQPARGGGSGKGGEPRPGAGRPARRAARQVRTFLQPPSRRAERWAEGPPGRPRTRAGLRRNRRDLDRSALPAGATARAPRLRGAGSRRGRAACGARCGTAGEAGALGGRRGSSHFRYFVSSRFSLVRVLRSPPSGAGS